MNGGRWGYTFRIVSASVLHFSPLNIYEEYYCYSIGGDGGRIARCTGLGVSFFVSFLILMDTPRLGFRKHLPSQAGRACGYQYVL